VQGPLVRRVLDIVGPPDGTASWRLRFSSELLGLTEAVAAAKQRLRCSLARLEEMRLAATSTYWGKGCHPYQTFMQESGLTFEQAARYIGCETIDLAKVVAPSNPEGMLEAERLLLDTDKPARVIARECGLGHEAIVRHSKRIGVSRQRRNVPIPSEIIERCRELRAGGMSYPKISEAIAAEFGRRINNGAICRVLNKAAAA